MPNTFAYIMLLLWPLVALVLYKKNPVLEATFWTIVGGYLLLPQGVDIDYPLIPALDKNTIPAISAFFGCRFIANKKVTFLPSASIERNLMLLFVLGLTITVMKNGDPIEEVGRFIPGLSYYDLFSVIISKYLLLLPFILGLQLIRSREDQIRVLSLLVIAGLYYSLLALIEIRLSPQLHNWIYGFFPHTWGQQVRYGGFRPVVFLGHGLWVSIFLTMVLGAAITLSKAKLTVTRFSNSHIILYLIVVLVLSKGFGSMILGAVLFFCLKLLADRVSVKIALLIAITAMTYPLMSVLGLFPHESLVELINTVDSRQGGSLQFRFNQEGWLLDRALERLWFGWGVWGRNRLADSVIDGYWIGLIGMYGVVGFMSIFGLMFVSLWKGASCFNLISDHKERALLAGNLLMCALIMLDQIPNHSENPLFWLLFGGLIGRQRYIKQVQAEGPKAKSPDNIAVGI